MEKSSDEVIKISEELASTFSIKSNEFCVIKNERGEIENVTFQFIKKESEVSVPYLIVSLEDSNGKTINSTINVSFIKDEYTNISIDRINTPEIASLTDVIKITVIPIFRIERNGETKDIRSGISIISSNPISGSRSSGSSGGNTGNNNQEGSGQSCNNECIEGEKKCLDETHIQNCIRDNGTNCMKWNETLIECPNEYVCVNGRCQFNFSKYNYYRYDDVLLLCNPKSNDSIKICSYFQSKRPTLKHIFNVSLTNPDIISCSEFKEVVDQIKGYLKTIPSEQINYIITTTGIPLKLNGPGCEYVGALSFDSMLGCNLTGICYPEAGGIVSESTFSDFYDKEEIFNSSKYNYYIVTRLTGYTVDDVKNLIDRSGPMNFEESPLNNSLFVLNDRSAYLINGKGRLYETYNFLSSNKQNIIYTGPGFGDGSMVPNASEVIGYMGWGPYNSGWNFQLGENPDFIEWENNEKPSKWNVSQGTITKSIYYNSTGDIVSEHTGKINSSGLFEIYQNYINQDSYEKRYIVWMRYGLINFTGNITLGIRGFNTNNNLINETTLLFRSSSSCSAPCSSTIKPVTTDRLSGNEWSGMIVTLRKNELIKKVQPFLKIELSNGEVYIDKIVLERYGPSFKWRNGAIGTLLHSFSATSFSSIGTFPIATLIEDGISGAEGFVSEPYVSAVNYNPILFKKYLQVYNLGDSFCMSSTSCNLAWKDTIIGDPKTIIVINKSLSGIKEMS